MCLLSINVHRHKFSKSNYYEPDPNQQEGATTPEVKDLLAEPMYVAEQ